MIERWTHRQHRLKADIFEQFFRHNEIAEHMILLSRQGVKRVVFADMGKNVLAYYRAAKLAGIDVLAVGDDGFAAPKRQYRGIAVVSLEEALKLSAQAVVIANSSPVHGSVTWNRVRHETDKPAHHWFLPEGDEKRDTAADSDTRVRTFDTTEQASALHACRA